MENQKDNTIVSGSAAAVSPEEGLGPVVEAQIVDDIVTRYYTIIYTYNENGAAWFGTGILTTSAEEALRQFQSYAGVKRFHIVRIEIKTQAG
jgi:hypothetical protein